VRTVNELSLILAGERTKYLPGEMLSGDVRWHFARLQRRVELRLFWHTSGLGARHSALGHRLICEHQTAQGTQGFSFQLPASPYSFRGSLITVEWAIELVAVPSNEAILIPIIIAPNRTEVAPDHKVDVS
jgi:hypothetical protein